MTVGLPQDRVKVLLLLTTSLGGTGLHAYHLAKYLDPSKFDVAVAYGPGQPLDRQIEELGRPVYKIRMKRSVSPFTHAVGFLQLWQLMRSERFDIVCMQCSIAGALGRIAARLAGVRVSVFIIQLYASHDYLNSFVRRIYLGIERALDRVTDHYVAVSNAIKTEGLRKEIFKEDKISVIYNAIELEAFDSSARPVLRVASEAVPLAPVVGTICRLEPQKGIPFLLRAMDIVHREMPGVRFLIVGDGPLRSEMEKLAVELGLGGSIEFTGWRHDTAQLLASMDLFCLASLWESFGYVFVEAMAMKRPIVATAIGGIPEVVKSGTTGFLVPPENPEALAEAMLKLLRDPELARRFGEAGRLRVQERFTVPRMVAEYDRLFQHLASRAWRRHDP